MKKINLAINVLIILVFVLFLYKQFSPARGVNQIGADDLKKLLKNKKYQLVDVRTPGEFHANHIKGFKNIPLQEVKQRQQEFSKEKEVVVICQSGMRSNRAAKLLKKLGFEHLSNVKGGMSAWR